MKYKLYKILIVNLLFIAVLLAQDSGKITGRVLDKLSKAPLAGVNVVVVNQLVGGSTDLEGYFRINRVPLGTHRLEVSYIGYKPAIVNDVVVTTAKPAVVSVSLIEEAFESDAIVVTAGYFVDEEETQPSKIGLTREEIRRFPGGFEDVVRTVSTLPGVAVASVGGRNDLLVRGGGPSENLYVINNIEVPNINHFGSQGTSSGSLSFINLDFVENVSFSTGGFPARFGDKMSSVLELEMSEGRSDRIGGEALISATQFGLSAQGPIDQKGNYILSARRSYLDLVFKAAGFAFIPTYSDFNVLANYDFTPKDRLTFIGLAAIDEVERDLSSEENRVDNSGIMDNTQFQYITGFDYRHLLSTGYLSFTTNFNLFQYKFRQGDIEQREYFNSNSDEREVGLKIQNYHAFNKRLHILSGLSNKWVSLNSTTAFADTIFDRSGNRVPVESLGLPKNNRVDASSSKSAAFAEIEWVATQRLTANLGLRADYYNFLNQPFYFSPRLALSYIITSDFTLKASGGVYYQSPSYVWMNNPVNEDLKALRNEMIVLGATYLLREDLRMSVEGFYKNYSDLPTGTTPGVTDHLVITNTGTTYGGREDDFQSFGFFPMSSDGKGEAYGAEWFLQKRFSDIPLYGQFSLAWAETKYTAGNGKSYFGQYDQRFIMNLSAGYIFDENWEVSGKFRYFTGIPYTPVYRPSDNLINPGNIQNIPDEYLSGRLADGHHLDIRVDRYFNFSKWTLILFLDIQNVYNFDIPQRPRYNFWEDKVQTTGTIGILPSIGVSFEF